MPVETTLYDAVGGGPTWRKLVDRFYDVMDADPAVADLRAMHPEDLTSSRDKLYEFLCGWSGGPPLYVSKHGHPRLRMRHLPFPIDDRAAMEWMHCMRIALDEVITDPIYRERLEQNFARIAVHMRNRE